MGKKNPGAKPGPDADRLALDGDWKDAVKKAVNVKRPKGGWPKPNAKKPPKKKPTAEE